MNQCIRGKRLGHETKTRMQFYSHKVLSYSNNYIVSFGPSPAMGELGNDCPIPDSLSSDPEPLCCCCCCCSLESL